MDNRLYFWHNKFTFLSQEGGCRVTDWSWHQPTYRSCEYLMTLPVKLNLPCNPLQCESVERISFPASSRLWGNQSGREAVFCETLINRVYPSSLTLTSLLGSLFVGDEFSNSFLWIATCPTVKASHQKWWSTPWSKMLPFWKHLWKTHVFLWQYIKCKEKNPLGEGQTMGTQTKA